MKTTMNNKAFLELLQDNPTPFYFYSRKVLTDTINELKNAFPISNFQLLFATMANDNIEFIKTIIKNDVGACINSIKHFHLVNDCGMMSDRMQFTSTGLTTEDMKLLKEKDIAVNFDSLNQLEEWFRLNNGGLAGLRINTASLIKDIPIVDRLGVDKDQAIDAIELAKKYNGVVNGLHIYVGTNYKEHTEMLPALKEFFNLALSFPQLDYVNIGGGVGVDYMDESQEFDIKTYGKNIIQLVEELRVKLKKNIKLVFEPGRRLAASSGWFATKITDIKHLNNIRYIVVDASVSIFPRPLHHPDSPHKVITPLKNEESDFEDSVIVGKTTFSKDILSKSLLSKKLIVGDIIIFEKAGAYCDSMRSKFLGQNEPKNLFIE